MSKQRSYKHEKATAVSRGVCIWDWCYFQCSELSEVLCQNSAGVDHSGTKVYEAYWGACQAPFQRRRIVRRLSSFNSAGSASCGRFW
jgi:hypothetical protein